MYKMSLAFCTMDCELLTKEWMSDDWNWNPHSLNPKTIHTWHCQRKRLLSVCFRRCILIFVVMFLCGFSGEEYKSAGLVFHLNIMCFFSAVGWVVVLFDFLWLTVEIEVNLLVWYFHWNFHENKLFVKNVVQF